MRPKQSSNVWTKNYELNNLKIKIQKCIKNNITTNYKYSITI